ncbi:CDP-alcohol phosphatidyltransferase [Frankineae bacterium MT45]|nr:CDP-alcohol phosphatidyltransferase [Frankineae bacterium MT45]
MVRAALGIGFAAGLAVLAGLSLTVGLTFGGWLVGIAVALVVNGLLASGLARAGTTVGPADRVTLLRAALVGGVCALIVSSISGAISLKALVVLASVALILDGVDGRVARATGTVSALGARFDLETDALLILALSCYDARLFGRWVLLIGAARYLLLAAGSLWPWLREPAPPRYWCKVVAAIQGILLTAIAPQLLPVGVAVLLLLTSLGLLAESFGREVLWLYRHRGVPAPVLLVSAQSHV